MVSQWAKQAKKNFHGLSLNKSPIKNHATLFESGCQTGSNKTRLHKAQHIASSLKTFSFSHTKQQGNFVTHALAKRVRLYFPLLVWMEHIPLDIYIYIYIYFSIFWFSSSLLKLLGIDSPKKKKKRINLKVREWKQN